MYKLLPLVQIIHALTPILKELAPEMDRITKELRKDTVSLNLATSELDSELKKTRNSIDSWYKLLRPYNWWTINGK